MGKKTRKNGIIENANTTKGQNKGKEEFEENMKVEENLEKQLQENGETEESLAESIKTSENLRTELIAKKENEISEVKLEKIEEEIKKQTTISDKRKKKIYNKIFKNIIVAILVIVYFIFINLGYKKLAPEIYLIDQQVFSFITLGITILIFERAYKKDDGEMAMFGVEALALSICTLMTTLIVANYNEKYIYVVTVISIVYEIYYVAKSIFIYCKMRNKALKRTSDIRKIGRVKG